MRELREMAGEFCGFLFRPWAYCTGEPMLYALWFLVWALLALMFGLTLRLVDDATARYETAGPGVVVGREHSPETWVMTTQNVNGTPIMQTHYIPPSWSLRVHLETGEEVSATVTEARYAGTPDGTRVVVTRGRTRLLGRLIVTGIE